MASRSLPALLTITLALSACSLAPDYQAPAVPLASAYQGNGPWAPAQPTAPLPYDGWWKSYQDAQLDDLQQRLLANNADLSAALAHYQQAQAYVSAAQADMYPQLSGLANPQRDRQSDNRPLRGNPRQQPPTPKRPRQSVFRLMCRFVRREFSVRDCCRSDR